MRGVHPHLFPFQRRVACGLFMAVASVSFWSSTALLSRGEQSPALSAATASVSGPATTQATTQQKRAEEVEHVMEFFRVAQPDTYEQAKTLRDSDPARFDKLIHGASSMVNKLQTLKRRNPPLFDLRMKDFELAYKTVQLAKDIQKIPNPNDRGPQMRELTNLVSEQFDLRQKIRQMEIDDLRKQLADLEDELKTRSQDKDSLIRKRMDELLMPSPPIQW